MEKKILCVVLAIIRDEQGKFLLSKRFDPDIKEADGKWDFAGGKLEFGEKLEEAVVREAKEETGLDVEVVKLIPYVTSEFWKKSEGTQLQTVLISYECKIIGGKLHTKNFDHKIKELKFVDLKDFKNYPLLSNVVEIAQAVLKGYPDILYPTKILKRFARK